MLEENFIFFVYLAFPSYHARQSVSFKREPFSEYFIHLILYISRVSKMYQHFIG